MSKQEKSLEALITLKEAITQIEEIHQAEEQIDFAENSSLSSPSLLQVSMDIEAEVFKSYGELCESNGDLKNAIIALKRNKTIEEPVSYTHLTLPTKA